MFDPVQWIRNGIEAGSLQAEPIPGGKSGGRLLRVRSEQGAPLIVKLLQPAAIPQHLREDFPYIAVAEYRFYTELMHELRLPGPALYASGQIPDGTTFLIMEDLTPAHLIPAEGHRWNDRELAAVMRSFGLLHGRSLRLLQEQPAPSWLHADPRATYDPDQVLGCLEAFAANPWTADQARPVAEAPGLRRLAEALGDALCREPTVLLYNDFHPSNVALPADGGPAKLFDWQLVGTGPMQVDICNIGLLGRDPAFAGVDRSGLLDLYLDTFAAESGHRPDTEQFRASCRDAHLLGWSAFMPRMVKAMERCNAEGRQFSPWMAATFRDCMTDWLEALNPSHR